MGCPPVSKDNPRALASCPPGREDNPRALASCPPGREDNPRALASGLFYVQADNPWYNYFIPPTSVYRLHSTGYFVLKLVRVVKVQ